MVSAPQPRSGPASVPVSYWVWLAGTTISMLGTQILAFGMAWIATGRGGLAASLVVTAIVAPRVLLLLLGGWIADRLGAWRVMIVADATMVGVTGGLALGAWVLGDRTALLLVTALAIGIVDAFYLPSSGSMPRRLVPAASLVRAMAAGQVSRQLTVFAGPPLGGLLVAAAGLVAAALANAVSFAVMLLVLVTIRPRREPEPATPSPASGEGVWRGSIAGTPDPGHRPPGSPSVWT